MPALTKILFFDAFFHGFHLPPTFEHLCPQSHCSPILGDGSQWSHPLGQGCLAQPWRYPHATCWGLDPEGAEHPREQEHSDPGWTRADLSEVPAGMCSAWGAAGSQDFFGRTGAVSPQCLFLFVLSVS